MHSPLARPGSKLRVTAVAGLLVVTAACGGSSEDVASDAGATPEEDITIGLVSALASISYYTTMNCGAQAAAEELGVEVVYEAPNAFDAAEQQQIIQSLLVREPDGLIVVPADTTALNNTLSQTAEEIPVMTTDLAPSEEIGLASIASDGTEGGALAAEYMAEQLAGQSGSVLVLANSPTIVPVVQRAEGFIDAMAETAPDIEVLPIQYSGGEPSDAATIVSNTIRANPDLVGVFATFEPSVFGTMSALAGTDKEEAVTVVGYDADPAEVEALREGKIDALVIQTPYEMGYQAVTQMTEVIRGEQDAEEITYEQTTPVVLATAENLETPEVSKYLYTTSC